MASEHIEVPVELMTNVPVQEAPLPQVEGAPAGGEVPAEMVATQTPVAPQATNGADYTTLGAVGGAGLGTAAAKATAVKDISVSAMKHALASNNPQVREAAKKVTELLPGTERWKQSANEISEASKKVVQDTNIRKKAPQFTRQEWKMGAKELSPMAEKLAVISPVAKAVGKYAMRYANPVMGGALAGAQGMNAMQDLNQGDYVGAGLNALGAGAGAAAMWPPAAPIAIPISAGAEAINYMRRDPELMKKLLANTKPAPKMFSHGGCVYMAYGGAVHKLS